MPFVQARREKSYLRLGLAGHSKSGKSRTSLILATGLIEYLNNVGELVGNGRIAVIDTERRSSKKYAMAHEKDIRDDAYDFDVMYMDPPYSPEAYVKAFKEAEKAQYSVLIVDQITHEWDGAGGILEIHAELLKNSNHNNGYVLWRDVMPRHNAFIESFLGFPGHVICTMRSKVKYRFNKDTKEIVKLGYKPIQKGEILYEFDGVGSMDAQHTMKMDPSRCPFLDNAVFPKPGKDLAYGIGEWLTLGVTQTEVKRAPLDKEKTRTIYQLFKKLEMSDDEQLETLSKRGASEVEELTPVQADELIEVMSNYISKRERAEKREQQRKAKAQTESTPSLPGASDSAAQPPNDAPFGDPEVANQLGDELMAQFNKDALEKGERQAINNLVDRMTQPAKQTVKPAPPTKPVATTKTKRK